MLTNLRPTLACPVPLLPPGPILFPCAEDPSSLGHPRAA